MDSNKKKEEDKILLETYMWGFNDELDGKTRMWNPNPLLLRAYDLGRLDAIVGDDVSSVDLQTNEEILERIRRGDSDDE
jgi:ABC-type amino acid transport substrate-binding protein